MTAEVEIFKFLKENNLPRHEVVYRAEDCAYLVIKTIEELQVELKDSNHMFQCFVDTTESQNESYEIQLEQAKNQIDENQQLADGYLDKLVACQDRLSLLEGAR